MARREGRPVLGPAVGVVLALAWGGCSDEGPIGADMETFVIRDSMPRYLGSIGDPCIGSSDCKHAVCLLTRGTGAFPDGYCSKPCDAANPTCPAGTDCVGTQDGNCFKLCGGDGDCRDGYHCVPGPAVDAPEICFPR